MHVSLYYITKYHTKGCLFEWNIAQASFQAKHLTKHVHDNVFLYTCVNCVTLYIL